VKAAKAAWKLPLVAKVGCPISGKELIKLWFNGELFHRDPAKKAKLGALRDQVGEGTVRFWLMLAFTYAQAVLIEFHIFLRDRTDLYESSP